MQIICAQCRNNMIYSPIMIRTTQEVTAHRLYVCAAQEVESSTEHSIPCLCPCHTCAAAAAAASSVLRLSLSLSRSPRAAATAACFSSASRLASSRAALIFAATAFTRLFSDSIEGLGSCPATPLGGYGLRPGWLPPAGLGVVPDDSLLSGVVGAEGVAVALGVVPDLLLLLLLLLVPALLPAVLLPGLLIWALATTLSLWRGQ